MQRKDKTPFPQIGEVEKSVGGLTLEKKARKKNQGKKP